MPKYDEILDNDEYDPDLFPRNMTPPDYKDEDMSVSDKLMSDKLVSDKLVSVTDKLVTDKLVTDMDTTSTESIPLPPSSPYQESSPSQESSSYSGGSRQFNVGDAVNFMGDYKQGRKWTITEFEKGFAILQTEDSEGLDSNVKVAGLVDIKPYVEPQVQIQPQQLQPPVVLNMYNVNGNDNTLQPQPVEQPVEQQEQVEQQPIDFSKPKIKIEEKETPPNLLKGGAIVVKKL